MAKISVINLKGEKVGDLELSKDVWNVEVNESVLTDAVLLQRNSLRQGTSSTKTRAEVSGTGAKPWRQKGTGRARQGSKRSPQWPGGGIVFGPKPRSYSKKMNRKERRLAIKSALSQIVLNKNLIVVENLNLETPKTKDLSNTLRTIKASDKSLLVSNEAIENLILASRNSKSINALTASDINVLSLLATESLIIEKEAVKTLEGVLK